MGKNTPIPAFLPTSKFIRQETARVAASEAVKFFKESFVNQGFTDSSLQKWRKLQYKKRKGSGKRILYSGGNLRDSIKKRTVNTDRVVVVAEAVYADIHNSGGIITRNNGTKIKIPKRQFMGNSKKLMEHLANKNIEITKKEMLKAFKRIKF